MLQTVFLCLIVTGGILDVRFRRIPNAFVIAILIVSICGAWWHISAAASLPDALLGSCVGLGLWLPFWLLGLLGAGDVKYFATAAAWVGVDLAWRAALLAALIGGVLSVLYLLYARGWRATVGQLALQANHPDLMLASADVGATSPDQRTFPYAIPMGAAMIVAVLSPAFLLNS